jgi:hypothetical protein
MQVGRSGGIGGYEDARYGDGDTFRVRASNEGSEWNIAFPAGLPKELRAVLATHGPGSWKDVYLSAEPLDDGGRVRLSVKHKVQGEKVPLKPIEIGGGDEAADFEALIRFTKLLMELEAQGYKERTEAQQREQKAERAKPKNLTARGRRELDRKLEALDRSIKAKEQALDALSRAYQIKNMDLIRLRGSLKPDDPIYGAFASGKKPSPAETAALKEKVRALEGEMKADRKKMQRLEKAIDDTTRAYHIVYRDRTNA